MKEIYELPGGTGREAAEVAAVEDILIEDLCRMEDIEREFDPLSGRNSVGERFQLDIPDDIFEPIYLPIAMKELPLIRLLEESRAFHALPGDWADRCLSEEETLRLRTYLPEDEEPDPIELALIEFTYLRMLHDFPFWAVNCVSIKSKGGGADIPFRLNRPQRRLVEHLEAQRLAGEPIRTILLKARQWGGSTCVQMYMAWLQLLHEEGLNSLIIAHQGSGSDEIKDMFDRMLGAYPVAALYYGGHIPAESVEQKITENVGKSGMITRVCPRNCKIKIGTAERPDSCRGGDYNLVHLSEVGIWRLTDGKSPEDIVRSACGGILLAPMTMIVYESTANGTGNFFHREYLAATRGESQFRPLFIAWYEIDQYSLPIEDDEERREIARRLWMGRKSQASGERYESGEYLWRLWEKGATLESLKWYVEERKKYNCHARMAAEYPSDDIEAFAHSGSIVFAREDVEAMRKSCMSPLYVGDIVSAEGEESIRALSFRGNPNGELEIWERPDAGGIRDRYVVTVDVGGRSAKSDWSVIAVLDRGPMIDGGVPRIVAQWRGHCDMDQLAWRSARVAAYYNNALLIIESNTLESREPARMVDGDELPSILCQIRDVYPNLYARRSGIENLRHGQELKLGFHTNAATKPMVIATLIRVVREGLYEERSDAAVDEFLTYERRPNGSYGAILGAHDDLLMTRAIGLHVALHEMDMPRRREARMGRRGRRGPACISEAVF